MIAEPAPTDVRGRYTIDEYFDLERQGVLGPDDRVELLEGVVVSMSPPSPWHDSIVNCVDEALQRAVGSRAAVRCQSTLILQRSAPQPDVAVVAGTIHDYFEKHPTTALLVVECADTSLPQDRLSKSRIYAVAGIPEYWIVSRRDDAVEVFRDPELASATYQTRRLVRRGERIALVAIDASVALDELLPPGASVR